ncbi:MAG TPA: glycosyltransferase family 2 protein [Candidatus Saccharimonadales bacterium]|nr:glycosyltransferase family 2 protein [Candidatus Saccharimonadales bacterium]
MNLIGYFIVTIGIVNVVRMLIYLLSSDIYFIKESFRKQNDKQRRAYRPSITVVVPAHNEGSIIIPTMESLQASNYPKSKMKIVVVDDGSTDNTAQLVKNYVRKLQRSGQPYFATKVVRQPNHGKAEALNNGMRNYADTTLVMCLDADSLVDKEMIKNSAAYFRDRKVAALASNVNIMEDGSLLSLVQRFEYLISYHMKKAQTTLNIEYIIGGIGSVFRRTVLKKVDFYDTNTMTEDIDLTMKIIAQGNKKFRVVYAADALTYTEAVHTFNSLIKQRFRWKYGRMQTFLKNPRIFFNIDKKYSKQLTWAMLPFAVLQELLFLVEPVVITYLIYIAIHYRDTSTMLIAMTIITSYISLNVWSTLHLSRREKVRLTLLAPPMYFLMYMMSIVEYAALIQALIRLPKLKQSISGEKTTWKSPERITEFQGANS